MALTAKRLLDLVVGVPAAVLLTPMIALVALAILPTSGSPVFLIQTRVGAYERPIRVVKFRTVRRGAPVVAKALLAPSPELSTPIGPSSVAGASTSCRRSRTCYGET